MAAIVPAYNEQETLADVLTVLKETPLVDEVLVVSDGSTDDTVRISQQLQVKTIHLRKNYGKAMAMAIGVAHTEADVLVFVDGDILNLSGYLLGQLVEPVVSDRSDMVIGVRNRGWLINAIHRKTGPLLSGIRCVRREIFEAVPEAYLQGFTVETALNWAARQLGRRCATVVLCNLRHMVKERKRGLSEGVRTRCAMFAAVFTAWLALTWKRPGLRRGEPRAARPELDYINW
ncbi:MAG TPA: glycosyltransferase family 2 protein [Thermoanaerobaculia bacterium]|nr:glycosyltransferase family 2 protein [Thermoanaerobaculia bacterium]